MRNIAKKFVLATIGGVVWGYSPMAIAQSEGQASRSCRPGYWQMGSLCLNNSTGDVVYAETTSSSNVLLEAGCAPGYWRLDSLCLHSDTGDVELVDEKRWPDGQRADARSGAR